LRNFMVVVVVDCLLLSLLLGSKKSEDDESNAPLLHRIAVGGLGSVLSPRCTRSGGGHSTSGSINGFFVLS
jgi:hypothetical protein